MDIRHLPTPAQPGLRLTVLLRLVGLLFLAIAVGPLAGPAWADAEGASKKGASKQGAGKEGADKQDKPQQDKQQAALLEQALAEQDMITAAIQRALKAFVFVGARGSAVLISPDGYILTNDHVAGSQPRWRVRTVDGTTYIARLVGTDPYGDISLLKIDGVEDMPHIAFGDSDKAKVGETVIAVGNPFGMSNIDERPTVTVGVISAKCRPQIRKGLPDSVQTDAPINPGNSGGPLISLDGKLIGINGQIHTRHETRSNTGIGYAISVNQIKHFMPHLKAADGGMVRHGWIKGLKFRHPDDGEDIPDLGIGELISGRYNGDLVKRYLARAGNVVARVPARLKDVLQKGDVIVAVEGHETIGAQHALARILSYPAGAEVPLTVRRGEQTLAVRVKLDPFFIRGQADLGVTFVASGGARLAVTGVEDGTPAARAGLKVGDRVISMAGIELKAPSAGALKFLHQQLRQQLFPSLRRTGAKVELSVLRDGKPVQLILEVPRGPAKLGMNLDEPAKPAEVRALQVRAVLEGGAAERAGVKAGDVILGFDFGGGERMVENAAQLAMMLRAAQVGQKAKLLIERDGERQVLEIKLGLKRQLP